MASSRQAARALLEETSGWLPRCGAWGRPTRVAGLLRSQPQPLCWLRVLFLTVSKRQQPAALLHHPLQVCQSCLGSSLVAWLQQGPLPSAPGGQLRGGGQQQAEGSCGPEEAEVVQRLEARALQQGLPLPPAWLQPLARQACRLGAAAGGGGV
jgi:hypothetical protein